MQALAVGRQFAAALDAEDYSAVLELLAATCVYHAPQGAIIGPEGIVRSYRIAGESACRLDTVEYSSTVEAVGSSEAVVLFTDQIHHRGLRHVYRCRQRLRVDSSGRIEEIRHEELPGERERLNEFLSRTGAK